MRWMISIRKSGKIPHLMMALWQGPKPPDIHRAYVQGIFREYANLRKL